MAEPQPEISYKRAAGSLNHGGWFNVEGKQLAVYAVGDITRITEAFRNRFVFLNLNSEAKQWLIHKIQVSEKEGWIWKDDSFRVANERFCVFDKGNSNGRFLSLQLWGRINRPAVCIPFGKGGWGWSKLAQLLSVSSEFVRQKTSTTFGATVGNMMDWEKDKIVVVRNHNSKLVWEEIAGFLNLKLLPVSNLKALALVADIAEKKSWLSKRMVQFQTERIYFNEWQPRCNRVIHERAAWFRVFGLPLNLWNESFGQRIGIELGKFVTLDENSINGTQFESFRLKVIPRPAKWAGGQILVENKDFFGEVFAVRETEEVQTSPEKTQPLNLNFGPSFPVGRKVGPVLEPRGRGAVTQAPRQVWVPRKSSMIGDLVVGSRLTQNENRTLLSQKAFSYTGPFDFVGNTGGQVAGMDWSFYKGSNLLVAPSQDSSVSEGCRDKSIYDYRGGVFGGGEAIWLRTPNTESGKQVVDHIFGSDNFREKGGFTKVDQRRVACSEFNQPQRDLFGNWSAIFHSQTDGSTRGGGLPTGEGLRDTCFSIDGPDQVKSFISAHIVFGRLKEGLGLCSSSSPMVVAGDPSLARRRRLRRQGADRSKARVVTPLDF